MRRTKYKMLKNNKTHKSLQKYIKYGNNYYSNFGIQHEIIT